MFDIYVRGDINTARDRYDNCVGKTGAIKGWPKHQSRGKTRQCVYYSQILLCGEGWGAIAQISQN